MNTKLVLDRLMARLGNRTSTTLRSNTLQEMLTVQTQLEDAPELPWFIITEGTQTVTPVTERRLKLPNDFLREVEESPLYILPQDSNEYVVVVKGDYQDLEEEYTYEAVGQPKHFTIRNDYLIFFPAPDFAYTVRFPNGYYARQTPPEDNEQSENPWFKYASDLMLAMTGVIMSSQYIKDPELVQTFMALQATAESRYVKALVAREEANRDRVMNPK